MDLLERSSAWLDEQRRKHCSRPVTYQRGSDAVPVQATIGRTVFEQDDGGGALLKIESRDYLISAADLVLGGTTVLPQSGDTIREEQDGQTYIYMVSSPGSEPAWRYSDAYRRTLRIHTKQIDVEE